MKATRELPETFTSIRAKLNGNVKYAIDNMNAALKLLCEDPDVSPEKKLRATQDYLALFMRLESEVAKEAEQKEITKQRKLTTKIKQAEVNRIEDEMDGNSGIPIAIMQSRFDPDNVYS